MIPASQRVSDTDCNRHWYKREWWRWEAFEVTHPSALEQIPAASSSLSKVGSGIQGCGNWFSVFFTMAWAG